MKSAFVAFIAVVFTGSSVFAAECNILNPKPVDQWECDFHINLPYADLVSPRKVVAVTISPTAEDRAVEHLPETLEHIYQR